jgi:pyruvate,water dikinase
MAGLEDHNHLIEQVAGGQLRLAIMAAARWLVGQGVLAAADDVFWLTFAEIEGGLRRVVQLREISAGRQGEWAEWAGLVPPPILGMPEAALPPRPAFMDEVNTEDGGEENGRLVGLGASPGQVEGPALVMLKGYLLPELEAGTILVAQNAGPLWTPYFPQLGGLVLEEGSLGQHAAATAREYGIPAVINCRQATQVIGDGEWIRVDGLQGTVEIMSNE